MNEKPLEKDASVAEVLPKAVNLPKKDSLFEGYINTVKALLRSIDKIEVSKQENKLPDLKITAGKQELLALSQALEKGKEFFDVSYDSSADHLILTFKIIQWKQESLGLWDHNVWDFWFNLQNLYKQHFEENKKQLSVPPTAENSVVSKDELIRLQHPNLFKIQDAVYQCHEEFKTQINEGTINTPGYQLRVIAPSSAERSGEWAALKNTLMACKEKYGLTIEEKCKGHEIFLVVQEKDPLTPIKDGFVDALKASYDKALFTWYLEDFEIMLRVNHLQGISASFDETSSLLKIKSVTTSQKQALIQALQGHQESLGISYKIQNEDLLVELIPNQKPKPISPQIFESFVESYKNHLQKNSDSNGITSTINSKVPAESPAVQQQIQTATTPASAVAVISSQAQANSGANNIPSPTNLVPAETHVTQQQTQTATTIIAGVEVSSKAHDLIEALTSYIDRIDSYSKDFSHGFVFFKASQAVNREANYELAKQLKTELEKGSNISLTFSDLKTKRDQLIADKKLGESVFGYMNFGIHSNKLNSIIKMANDDVKQEDNKTPKV